VETGIQGEKTGFPRMKYGAGLSSPDDRIAKPFLTYHTRCCRYGFLLEFIPMNIGAAITENSLFRLPTRPSRIKLFSFEGV
jgi:hypothetical protein